MNRSDNSDPPDTPQAEAERKAAASRTTWTSVVVNLVLTVVQIVVGVMAKSQSLVADGIHSLSDLVADFVVLFASHHSGKAADEGHPYGHQRFETAASLVLGGLLLAVGLGMLWSAVGKLESPESVPTVHVAALWVAGGRLSPAGKAASDYLAQVDRDGVHVLAVVARRVEEQFPAVGQHDVDAGGGRGGRPLETGGEHHGRDHAGGRSPPGPRRGRPSSPSPMTPFSRCPSRSPPGRWRSVRRPGRRS